MTTTQPTNEPSKEAMDAAIEWYPVEQESFQRLLAKVIDRHIQPLRDGNARLKSEAAISHGVKSDLIARNVALIAERDAFRQRLARSLSELLRVKSLGDQKK